MSLDLNPTAPRPENETKPLVDRAQTNPMFNDQKMKLGLFGTNCSYGLIMSHAPTTYEATWAHTKEIAQRADALGFEALVPIARGVASAAPRTSTATASRPTRGRRGWPRPRRTSASSPPRTCPPCTRSSPRRPPSRSTTSRAGGSGSTW